MTARDATTGQPRGDEGAASDEKSDESLPDTTDEHGIPLDNPSG